MQNIFLLNWLYESILHTKITQITVYAYVRSE